MTQIKGSEDRVYLAHGALTLSSGKEIECYLLLSYDVKDNLEIACSFYLKDDDVGSVIETLDSRDVQYASFTGSLSQGGTVTVEKMGLDSGTMTSYSPKDSAVPKYEVKMENLVIILKRIGILSSIRYYLHSNFLIVIRYITVSPISIEYEKVDTSETLTFKMGLSNFEFGKGKSDSIMRTKESFEICLPTNKIWFEKTDNYYFVISNLVKKGGSAVTCEAIFQDIFTHPNELAMLFSNVCFLLSLATSNWVTEVYCDLFKGSKLIQTVIFNTKRRRFIKSQYLINIRNIEDLKNYLEITIPKYSQLIEDFPLNKSIDYIISSLGSSTLQDSFIIAYVALENLCSKIEEFSQKHGTRIRPQSIDDMKNLLKKLFDRYDKSFTEEELGVIANKVAYKKISIKQAQKYILSYYNVTYDDATIEDLYEVRSSLFHGGDFEHALLRMKTNELYDLISKALLKMLGWNGAFLSKQRGYMLVKMD